VRAKFRITGNLLKRVQNDLALQHPFAHERIGFLKARPSWALDGTLLMLGADYLTFDNQDYINNPKFGALIGSKAVRCALQVALSEQVGLFLTHIHDHRGVPTYSAIDLHESNKLIPDFFKVAPQTPHGTVLLSLDSIVSQIWMSRDRKPILATDVNLVGDNLSSWRNSDAT
jgi:hypothetical protein